MITRNDLGRRIRAQRERVGLSQTQAADLAGVDRSTWNRHESGDDVPGLVSLSRIVRVLDKAAREQGLPGVRVADLIED